MIVTLWNPGVGRWKRGTEATKGNAVRQSRCGLSKQLLVPPASFQEDKLPSTKEASELQSGYWSAQAKFNSPDLNVTAFITSHKPIPTTHCPTEALPVVAALRPKRPMHQGFAGGLRSPHSCSPQILMDAASCVPRARPKSNVPLPADLTLPHEHLKRNIAPAASKEGLMHGLRAHDCCDLVGTCLGRQAGG